MGKVADQLLAYQHRDDAYEISHADVAELQIAAMNERLQERVGKIALLAMRAKSAGIETIERLEDMVPLLLPHTAYKSYPEKFLIDKRWDKLTKWLSTVSTATLDDVDLAGLADIDEWVERLAEAGHYLSCSSGTTGNPAMLMSSTSKLRTAFAGMLPPAPRSP